MDDIYNCPHCSSTFKEKRILDTHLLTHTNVKQHSCSKCSKQFTQKAGLDVHIRSVHLRIKSYSCTACSQAFSSKSELHVHLGTHGKDGRIYRCQICNTTFVQKGELLRHLNSALHRGKRSFLFFFLCKKCGLGEFPFTCLKGRHCTFIHASLMPNLENPPPSHGNPVQKWGLCWSAVPRTLL